LEILLFLLQKKQTGRLKQDLILAKQYKLHTVMEKVTKAGINEAARLKRIIAHMQAEKLQLQNSIISVENERDESNEKVRRLSAIQKSPLEKQMNDPIALKEQYMNALKQIRLERDALQEHREELSNREQKIIEKEKKILELHKSNTEINSKFFRNERKKLDNDLMERKKMYTDKMMNVLSIPPKEEQLKTRMHTQKVYNNVITNLYNEYNINTVIQNELNVVQRQYFKEIERCYSDMVSTTAIPTAATTTVAANEKSIELLSNEMLRLQNEHSKRIDDVIEHHSITSSISNELLQIHKHYHNVIATLYVKQMELHVGTVYVNNSPSTTVINKRGTMHDSVSLVHSIVMEDIMKKHQLNHVVVGEMRIIQRSHENVIKNILTNAANNNRSSSSITNDVASAQKKHSLLMNEIIDRHGISVR
jgi:hypothetical protein